MLNGCFAAVVSPFNNGKLDIDAFERYVSHLAVSGISGVVVCGTTGESLSMSKDEKMELIKKACLVSNKKIKVIAGVMESVTGYCLDFIKDIEQHVDGFLCISPFYIVPSQRQIYDHFKTISESTERDIILYNIPRRTGSAIEFDTFKKLSELKNVVAIKECGTNLAMYTIWRSGVKSNMSFLSGNDETACGAFAMGASGVISVSANIVPELYVKMHSAFNSGNLELFNALRDKLAPVHELMFAEPSPGPLKYALSRLGFMKNELRRPLSAVSADLAKKLDKLIDDLQLIR
jgi:4-hydroxy-tetrahydrodipicolinate synthase